MKKYVLWILFALLFCAVTYGGCGGSDNLASVDSEESQPTNDNPAADNTAGREDNSSPTEDSSGSTVDLYTLTVHYTAQSGDTLTGRLYRDDLSIHIADGATVTLKDVSIENGSYGSLRYGIYCQGNATLILEGTNLVKGASFQGNRRSGIYVNKGNTLTIMGSGSLTAQGDGGGAPGIGAGYTFDRITGMMSDTDCGNIVIDGGTVNAIGGEAAPGIGSTSGTHGNITITNNVSRVAVTAGNYAKYSIGSLSYQSDSGTITIGGVVTGPIADTQFVYEP